MNVLALAMNEFAKQIAANARAHGFDPPTRKNMLVKLMLVVTEISEAAEDVRSQRWAHFGEEIADTIIRLLDISASLGIDMEAQILRKHEINKQRRYKHGGKTA